MLSKSLARLTPEGLEMKFGWDDRWAASPVLGLGMCIYCKFVQISLCVLRKGLFRGLPLPRLSSLKPWKKKKMSTEHGSLIILQKKAIYCTICRLCLLGPQYWSNNRQKISRCDFISAVFHDSSQELPKSKSKTGIGKKTWLSGCT